MPSPPPTYESLTHIEYLLESADAATLAHQTRLTAPIYARRAALVARIPHFWALVLEQAPPDVEVHIQPSDGEVLNAALVGVEVERFEVVTAADARAGAPAGDARSFLVRLRFDPARNTLFGDEVLEKRIYFRRAADGAGVRVSDPVPIAWRAGVDPTRGLTDLAVALHAAEKALEGAEPAGEGETRAEARERRRGLAERVRALPEHVELRKRVEKEAEGAASFFAWFAWRGGRRVGVREGRANVARLEAGFARAEAGGDAGETEEEEEEEEDELDAQAAEVDVFPAGEELALALAEDVWPGAIRYFTDAQEADLVSDADFESDGEEGGDDEEEEEEDEDEDVPPELVEAVVEERKEAEREEGALKRLNESVDRAMGPGSAGRPGKRRRRA